MTSLERDIRFFVLRWLLRKNDYLASDREIRLAACRT